MTATIGDASVTALANSSATSVPTASGEDKINDTSFKGLSVTATSSESLITVAASAEVDSGGEAVGIAASGEYMYGNSGLVFDDMSHRATRYAGRGGLGAVMGSKNFKAIPFGNFH